MTVIAWDGHTLAADKRSSMSWGAHDTVTKIGRHGDALYALTGTAPVAFRLREWWMAGAKAEAFPEAATKDDAASLIVISSDGVWTYSTGPYPELRENRYCAWGIGRDFAVAAMHCGKNAAEAVEVACIYSTSCGNGIDSLELGDAL